MKRYTQWLLAALCVPGLNAAPTTEAKATEAENQASLVLLEQSKKKICNILAENGVISEENAEAIIAVPVKLHDNQSYFRSSIILERTKEGLYLYTSPEVLARCQEHNKQDTAAAAEEYLGKVAEKIGEVDMWVRLQGDGAGIRMGEIDGWSQCVKVSAMNLFPVKKKELKDLIKSYSFGSCYVYIRPYVKWNEEKKVFYFNEEKFAEDKGL